MLGTELVLRGVLESTKEHSPVGPIITVGRDPGASIVRKSVDLSVRCDLGTRDLMYL